METSNVTIAATYALPTLQMGDNGQAVRFLQKLLIRNGYTDNAGNQLAFDAIFGPKTREAVIMFQTAYNVFPATINISTDGIVGQNTWRAISEYL